MLVSLIMCNLVLCIHYEYLVFILQTSSVRVSAYARRFEVEEVSEAVSRAARKQGYGSARC